MGRHGWIAHTMARILDLIRFRAARIVASVPGRLPRSREAPGSERRPLLAATGGPVVAAPTEHPPDLIAEFPGAERFEEPVPAGTVPGATLQDDVSPVPDDAREVDMAGDGTVASGGAGWSDDEMLTFTPDSTLDLVDEIEFSFEQEPSLGDSEPDSAAGSPVNDAATLGWVEGDGSRECPPSFPIKGNGNSHIYHLPGQASYGATIPELCFATEDAAAAEGYRPVKRSQPTR